MKKTLLALAVVGLVFSVMQKPVEKTYESGIGWVEISQPETSRFMSWLYVKIWGNMGFGIDDWQDRFSYMRDEKKNFFQVLGDIIAHEERIIPGYND